MLLIDVDGTLTDGGIYLTEKGDEFKKFNSKDGIGIKNAMKNGVIVGFISASIAVEIVKRRAEMLGVAHCYVGNKPKTEILQAWLDDLSIPIDEVAFVGDDINDQEIMSAVGFSACPANAVQAIVETADVVLEKNGGDACVREFIDKYLLS
ncbi:MAG: HAD hydrolase family protein [Bacteroidia bacterium]|nr:HAD hydrolase family protein [Bacteroidia bacterium]